MNTTPEQLAQIRERANNATIPALRAEITRLRDLYEDARQRADQAETKLHNASQVPVYVTGDDREFVYVTDLYEAIGLPVREVQH
jgi:hypothetical protein